MEFESLYQEIILDHARKPRNFGELADADAKVAADNPMCGDEITLFLKRGAAGELGELKFTGNACSICTASASMMTGKLKGKSVDAARRLSDEFQRMITGGVGDAGPDAALGDLRALEGVRQFPMRAKCATLAWHALDAALDAALDGRAERNISLDADLPAR